MPDINEVSNRINSWHHARNLVEGSKPKDQVCKLGEEYGEMCGAIARGRHEEIVDAIGDQIVVLSLLALQHGTTLGQCMSAAYEVIKDRTGTMRDGVFVRDCE